MFTLLTSRWREDPEYFKSQRVFNENPEGNSPMPLPAHGFQTDPPRTWGDCPLFWARLPSEELMLARPDPRRDAMPLVDDADVAIAKPKCLARPKAFEELVATAWGLRRNLPRSDKRGGANGARHPSWRPQKTGQ